MPVARGQVFVNEILEIIYQWHPGAGFKDIRRSLGFDRNIVRTYVKPAQIARVERGNPQPDEGELSPRLKAVPEKESKEMVRKVKNIPKDCRICLSEKMRGGPVGDRAV